MEIDQAMTTEQAARNGQVLVKNLRVACIELADTLCDEADETSSSGQLAKVAGALSFARNINTLFGCVSVSVVFVYYSSVQGIASVNCQTASKRSMRTERAVERFNAT